MSRNFLSSSQREVVVVLPTVEVRLFGSISNAGSTAKTSHCDNTLDRLLPEPDAINHDYRCEDKIILRSKRVNLCILTQFMVFACIFTMLIFIL